MISVWDFLLLDGWDWVLEIQGDSSMAPGDEFKSDRFKVTNKCYPVGLGMLSYGHDDAKYTELHVYYDKREIIVSPYMLYNLVGTWTGWLPSFFFVSRFSAVTDQYAIGSNPTILLPCKNSFEIRIKHPTRKPDGTDITAVSYTHLTLPTTPYV